MGTQIEWHASKESFRRAAAAVKRENGDNVDQEPTIRAYDIPTKRAALVHWLNTYTPTTDNG